MEMPAESSASVPSATQPDISWTGAVALAFVLLYTLTLAAGGGYVFYASTSPVSIPMGYGTPFINFPWFAAILLIFAAWLAGPVALLIVGLIHLLRASRSKLWPAIAWVVALAAGTAIGYVIWRDYGLLLSAYPMDVDGSPLGPSRWVPGGPYWPALAATLGQCAVGLVMIVVIIAPVRRRYRGEAAELSGA